MARRGLHATIVGGSRAAYSPPSVYDWLLFLHVLGATAFLGIAIAFWAVVVATRPQAPVLSARAALLVTSPLAMAIAVASVVALVFGVWLAIYVDGYELWDGWILASLVLWLVAGGVGERSGRAFTASLEASEHALSDRRRGIVLHAIATAALLVILYLMITKPGA